MAEAKVPQHPLLAALNEAKTALEKAAEFEPTYLSTNAKAEALLELVALRNQIESEFLRVLATSDDVAEAEGHRDAGGWLAAHANLDRPATHGDLKLARALDERYALVADGMKSGGVNRAQAAVIVNALDKLPDELPRETRGRAEAQMVEFAAHHGPKNLRMLGEHLLEVVAPEVAEELDAKALEREEQRARQRTSLKLHV